MGLAAQISGVWGWVALVLAGCYSMGKVVVSASEGQGSLVREMAVCC